MIIISSHLSKWKCGCKWICMERKRKSHWPIFHLCEMFPSRPDVLILSYGRRSHQGANPFHHRLRLISRKKTVSCQFEFVQLSVVFLLVSSRYLSSRNVSVGFNLEGLCMDFSGFLIFLSLLFANVLLSLRWPSRPLKTTH